MVTCTQQFALCLAAWMPAAEAARPLIRRLDPATRAKVVAALAALIILGFSMMLLAMVGARMTRRYMRRLDPEPNDPARRTFADDDWAKTHSQRGPYREDEEMEEEK